MVSFVLGIDLGGTKVEAALLNSESEIIGRGKAKTEAWRTDEEVFGRICGVARDALKAAQIEPSQLSCIGIGSPGPLDPDSGYIVQPGNLPFRNFPLGPRLSETFGCPAVVANDVDAGTYGEFKAGSARGAQHVLGMFIGTGIGGGIIINSQLYHGFSKNAGEVGYMIIEIGGARCTCGRRGCLEALASRTAITRDLRRAIKRGQKTVLTDLYGKNIDELPASALKEAVEEGDKLTKKVVRRAAKCIGVGIGSLVNVLGPEIVVLGGGLIEAVGDEIMAVIDRTARKTAFEFTISGVKIVRAELGDDAGVLGAAMLARENFQTSMVSKPA